MLVSVRGRGRRDDDIDAISRVILLRRLPAKAFGSYSIELMYGRNQSASLPTLSFFSDVNKSHS